MDLKKDWSEPASAKYTADENSITPRINFSFLSMSIDLHETSSVHQQQIEEKRVEVIVIFGFPKRVESEK